MANNFSETIKRFLNACLMLLLFLFPACNEAKEKESIKPIHPQELTFTSILNELDSLSRLTDVPNLEFERYWDTLKLRHGIPLVVGDSVAFLYRGAANSVKWNGDFNGWGSDNSFTNDGQKLGLSNVWMLKKKFPSDARLDYKIVVNGNNWMLDPNNPHQQWGGAGPNSELRMPLWQEDVATQQLASQKGTLLENVIINSAALGYKVQYKVYLPFGYDNLSNLPVVYVSDGHEYADQKMGAMISVIDYLIETEKIVPIIAVFVDPRDPDQLSQNRRMTELTINQAYLEFYKSELIPAVDVQYKTNASAHSRAILGTSLGGLNSAYFGISGSDYFGLIGIHSPAFWYKQEIYGLFENSEKKPIKIYMSTGVINDTESGARQMKTILQTKGYEFQYKEVNEGHSWGNWRALIDEVLLAFFDKE